MSRIGRMPIAIPGNVEVTIGDGRVTVKGPRGELSQAISPDLQVVRENGTLQVQRPSDAGRHRAMHGLTRTLIANMVTGVTQGFEKTLELHGVGYRVQLAGKKLVLQVGFSHPVEIEPPPGVEFANVETFSPTQANQWLSSRFSVRGSDKQLVGEIAAQIRRIRPPEPYKGKGIRYAGEQIRRKAGKSAAKGKK